MVSGPKLRCTVNQAPEGAVGVALTRSAVAADTPPEAESTSGSATPPSSITNRSAKPAVGSSGSSGALTALSAALSALAAAAEDPSTVVHASVRFLASRS